MDESSFILLYKSMVRPHLECANSVWCPYKQGDIKELEKIQKRATNLVINLKKIAYKDRLMHLKLPTLKYRRLRGDFSERELTFTFAMLRKAFCTDTLP